jgi:tetratricopeptide (TPR) repeat protein
LEALPIFQQLAKQNPNDADVIFGWGACLIDHSATLGNEAAANQERMQARELLVRAKELGNKSPLLLNLLEMLPEDRSIRHDKNAEVDQGIHDGEAAFAKNDYNAAIAGYSRAFALDPKNYSAALFIGDSYFAKKDFVNATIWYEHAIQIDPTIETAYRYQADMLIKNGDMAKARTRSIQAVVASPYIAGRFGQPER